ncbi:MAG: hypothetical protein JSV51_01310 [Candidatus Bathyarchaeota archaeon]|nr:MAG: hypothetical protein JSV51_01310 [Candidatus Bathyarchaeota archaeon]
MNEKIINKKAVYQPCWLSYTGAMAGSLQALGINCDIVDVGGYSGYAFLINVSKDVTCPSGPTALGTVWKQIHKATENLGWTLEHYTWSSHCYPEVEGKHTPHEIEVARKLFEKVKLEIKDRDMPVIVWGLVAPEYGIITGYKGESYLVSTFRHLAKQPEDPILFYDLHAPGGLEAFFFREKVTRDDTLLGTGTIERAIHFAEARDPTLENYVAGPKALDEWADVLERLPEEKQNYHGNSYVAACVCEARAISGQFLKRLADKYPGKDSRNLLSAAKCYKKGEELMEEFMQIFPFKFQGQMKAKDRKKGAELLRKIKPFEEEAINHMKKALETWRSQ